MQEGSSFSIPSPTFICRVLNDGHFDQCMISHCSFHLHFYNNQWCWESFSCVCWPSVYLLCRNVYLGLLPIFRLDPLFFYCWVVWAVCIFWKLTPLLVGSFANIFSHSVGFLLTLFMISIAVQKLVSLIRSYLFIFVFISTVLRDWPKKTLVWFMSENVLFLFLPRNSLVSCLMFKSLSHLEFVLCMVRGCVLTSLINMWLSNFPSTACWRDYLSPIVYSY